MPDATLHTEGLRTAGKAVGVAVGAAAGAAAARKVQEERVAAAGAVLHNLLVEQGPARLQRGDVAGLADRMGIDFGSALVGELKAAYDAYLQAVLPPGDAPLKCAGGSLGSIELLLAKGPRKHVRILWDAHGDAWAVHGCRAKHS